MEIRKGDLHGPVVLHTELAPTNGRQAVVFDLTDVAQGRGDLYLVFKNATAGKDQPVCMIEWFAFREALPPGQEQLKMQQTFFELNQYPPRVRTRYD